MAFTEDFSDFINPDTPGYVVAQINGGDVEGIFVNESVPASLGMAGFSGSVPEFTCVEADVAGIDDLEQIVIGAITYRVAEVNPDGTGMVVLGLKK